MLEIVPKEQKRRMVYILIALCKSIQGSFCVAALPVATRKLGYTWQRYVGSHN